MSLRENIPEAYREALERQVAILGVGASGQAVRGLLNQLGADSVFYDERSGDEDSVLRSLTPHEAQQHGLVIHSPAFRMDHPWLEVARAARCIVVSELEFAQQFRRGPTLVVTGTNGKTTLQEFITFCLKRSGISAVAAGQNQYPLSRLAVRPELDGVTAVCEVSGHYTRPLRSFRFETLFWTNFHEDHLEDMDSRRGLFEAVLHLHKLSPGARLYFGRSVFESARQFGLQLPDGALGVRPEDVPGWDLPQHSAFATSIHRPTLALFRRYWRDMGYSDSLLKSAAESFEVRAHRLHVTTRVGQVAFWNDSGARNFAATEAALDHFDEPVVWIGGGHYRGGDLRVFAGRLQPRLQAAVVSGDAGERLLPILRKLGVPARQAADLRGAVQRAYQMAEGEVPVVFSPGFPAGVEFGDFMERGMCFENAVLGLKHQMGSV